MMGEELKGRGWRIRVETVHAVVGVLVRDAY